MAFDTSMAILITGAAGFVGLNLTERLLRQGRAVVALDRIDIPARARREFATLPGELTFIGGSVMSAADLSRALTVLPVDAVIHCAVITAGADREVRDPEGIIAVNVQGAIGTLVAAARHGVRRFVYTSSIAVYGTAAMDVDPIREDLAARPVMIYGMTKLACEILMPRMAAVQGVEFAAARLSSVYGPWEYPTGVRDTLSPMLSVITMARAGREAVLSPPGRGDFCYAPDIAAGLVGLLDAERLSQPIYNLGSGTALTAEDWCRAVQRVAPGLRYRVAAMGEVANVISHVAFDRGAMDIGAIKRDTGYAPQFTFERAAADYLAWSDESSAAKVQARSSA